ERGLAITLNIPPDLVVRVSGEDLEEMLGNLMDNACKWARSRVDVSAAITGPNVAVVVDDDGVGLEPSMREHVLRRGVRLDEDSP
ncbi:two-component system sensor histidine kinase PhoQ, partial [Klebsiella pneumoniae]|nr:two-component system sensor histidine kinase PhoQ [Klebsiella pneumoniae]